MLRRSRRVLIFLSTRIETESLIDLQYNSTWTLLSEHKSATAKFAASAHYSSSSTTVRQLALASTVVASVLFHRSDDDYNKDTSSRCTNTGIDKSFHENPAVRCSHEKSDGNSLWVNDTRVQNKLCQVRELKME